MAEVMKVYASLHAHSTHSDGVYSPSQLAKIAYDEGYKACILTDHDTVSGTGEMISACKEMGLECMLGIEFTTRMPVFDCELHITAFHFDPAHPAMKAYLTMLSEKETEQTRILFDRGVDIGYIKGITWDEVLEYNRGITWLCNEHVFRAMKAKGLIADIQYSEFFTTCYGVHRNEVKSEFSFLDSDKLIELVHAAGGIACVAHPTLLCEKPDAAKALIGYGIDGIEVWHSLLTGVNRRKILKIAKDNDLYVSGGADHSGLLGGQYLRYEHPEETRFYFPPLTLGTTRFFYEEIRDKQKKADRQDVMERMLADDSLWISNGGAQDVPLK